MGSNAEFFNRGFAKFLNYRLLNPRVIKYLGPASEIIRYNGPATNKRLPGRTLLSYNQYGGRAFLCVALILLSCATTTAFAQDIAKATTEK